MNKHPHYNLWLHDDSELSSLTGSRIRSRITIHEWPLSCVQKVTCEDGRRVIYKSQYGPTVEPQFYARARSPILPQTQTLWQSDMHSCMLIEFLDIPLVRDLELSESRVLIMIGEIMEQIRRIGGDPPIFLNISTPEKWEVLVDDTIGHLRSLVESGRLQLVSLSTVRALEKIGHSSFLVSAYDKEIGFIHGDPNRDNIFVGPDGYRVIDWQRPKWGPVAIDKVAFLYGHNIDPAKYIDRGAVGIFYFLSLWWITQCQVRWITDGSYDRMLASWAQKIMKLMES